VVSCVGEESFLAWRIRGGTPRALFERATRLVFESGRPIARVACDLGFPSEAFRVYVRRVEANEGRRKDTLSDGEREEIR
jgi:transposase